MERAHIPHPGRIARTATLVAVVGGLLLAVPTAANASPQSRLTPTLTCVDVNPDGTVTAHFGYINTWTNQVNVPVGDRPGQKNYFSPNPEDRGQPTKFSPGTFTNVFTVTFTGTLTWYLDDATGTPNSVTASASSTSCASIPAFGIDSPLPVVLIGVGGGAWLAWRRRRMLAEGAS